MERYGSEGFEIIETNARIYEILLGSLDSLFYDIVIRLSLMKSSSVYFLFCMNYKGKIQQMNWTSQRQRSLV